MCAGGPGLDQASSQGGIIRGRSPTTESGAAIRMQKTLQSHENGLLNPFLNRRLEQPERNGPLRRAAGGNSDSDSLSESVTLALAMTFY